MAKAVSKWSGRYLSDLLERVGATFLGAVAGLVALSATTPVEWTNWPVMWTVVGVPTVLSLIKGLLANMAAPETGASLISSAPPGPEVHPEAGYAVLGAMGMGLVVLSVILFVLTALGAVSFSWLVLVVLFVVGLVLIWVDGSTGRPVR